MDFLIVVILIIVATILIPQIDTLAKNQSLMVAKLNEMKKQIEELKNK